jgi:hypothetical protein
MKDEKCNCEKCEGYQKYLAWKAEQRNQPESPPVATTYTKSYVSAPFGTEDSPLEQVELKSGEREIAVIPVSLLREMFDELRPILDSENDKDLARRALDSE